MPKQPAVRRPTPSTANSATWASMPTPSPTSGGRQVTGWWVEGLKSLNPDHADRLMRMVRTNEPALAEVLPKRRPCLRPAGGDGPAS